MPGCAAADCGIQIVVDHHLPVCSSSSRCDERMPTFQCRWPQIIFHKHVSHTRLLAPELEREGNTQSPGNREYSASYVSSET